MCLWSEVFYFIMGSFNFVKTIEVNSKSPVRAKLKRGLEKPC